MFEKFWSLQVPLNPACHIKLLQVFKTDDSFWEHMKTYHLFRVSFDNKKSERLLARAEFRRKVTIRSFVILKDAGPSRPKKLSQVIISDHKPRRLMTTYDTLSQVFSWCIICCANVWTPMKTCDKLWEEKSSWVLANQVSHVIAGGRGYEFRTRTTVCQQRSSDGWEHWTRITVCQHHFQGIVTLTWKYTSCPSLFTTRKFTRYHEA